MIPQVNTIPLAVRRLHAILKGRKGVRDYAALFNSTILTQLFGIIRGFVVAKFLGPVDYGILTGVNMVSGLEKYGNLGFKSVVTREAVDAASKGRKEQAEFIKNVGYSGEILLGSILAMVGGGIALAAKDPKISLAIAIAAVALWFGKVKNNFRNEAIIEKKITLQARVLFWITLVSSLAVIAAVPFFGIFASLTVPILGSIIATWWYTAGLDYRFRFQFDLREVMRQIKIGIFMALNSLAYGSYRYAERIMILTFLGVGALGFYGIASTIMNNIMGVLLLGPMIRKIGIFEKLGKSDFEGAHQQIIRETKVHVLAAALLLPPLWVALEIFIPWVLPAYQDALTICKLLPVAVVFRIIIPYLQVAIVSVKVNRQKALPPLQFASTALFVSTCFALKYLDSVSLLNIVIADVVCYALYSLSYLVLYKRVFYNQFVRL